MQAALKALLADAATAQAQEIADEQYQQGQKVEVYSASKDQWYPGQIIELDDVNSMVVVQYHVGNEEYREKNLPFDHPHIRSNVASEWADYSKQFLSEDTMQEMEEYKNEADQQLNQQMATQMNNLGQVLNTDGMLDGDPARFDRIFSFQVDNDEQGGSGMDDIDAVRAALGDQSLEFHSISMLDEELDSDTLEILQRGTTVLKHTSRGDPHFLHLQLTQDLHSFRWYSQKKYIPNTTIPITSITKIVEGAKAGNFKNVPKGQTKNETHSFSILYNSGYSSYTLDVVAKSAVQARIWREGLGYLMRQFKKGSKRSNCTKLDDFEDRPIASCGPFHLMRVTIDNDCALVKNMTKDQLSQVEQFKRQCKKAKDGIDKIKKQAAHQNIQKGSQRKVVIQSIKDLDMRQDTLAKHAEQPEIDTPMMQGELWSLDVDILTQTRKLDVIIANSIF